MPIKKPGKKPFAPWLKDFKALSKGGKKHTKAADILLTPLIDMFVLLVVFLIMNFSATGELVTISKDIKLPKASTTKMLERAPIIQISAKTVAVEGFKVGDSDDIIKDEDLRVPHVYRSLMLVDCAVVRHAIAIQVLVAAQHNQALRIGAGKPHVCTGERTTR